MLEKLQYFAISTGFVLILAFCSIHGVFAGGFSGAPLQLPLKVTQGGTGGINAHQASVNLARACYSTDLVGNTLASITTGHDDLAAGLNSAALLSSGVQDTAYGSNSLASLTTGNHNTAVGYYAGQALITGLDNIFVGANAGDTMTGSGNDVVGYFAGDGWTAGNYNSIFGDSAGNSGANTGSSNSFFGANAGSGLGGTDSNNTIIGGAGGTTGMNGNVILSDGAGNIVYLFDGTNNNFPFGNLQSAGKITLTHADITAGAAAVAITAGASPFAYTATYAGSVAISAGTVSAVTLTRAAVVVWSVTASNEIIPVRAGDVITVTYTVAPTMYQLTD